MADLFANMEEERKEKASFVVGVIGICFASLAASWSFVGSACCGWAGWPLAFVGIVLSTISLLLKRNKLGFWGLGLSIFAFVWVFITAFLFTAAI